MRPRWRHFARLSIVMLVAAFSMVIMPRAASAATPVLWKCYPFSSTPWTCTVVTKGPVQVKDHSNSQIVTLYNGNSVALGSWSRDSSGGCGVFGNPIVWRIYWYNGGTVHFAYIGDHYLRTGDFADWFNYPYGDGPLLLGDAYAGYGSGGTCDVYTH